MGYLIFNPNPVFTFVQEFARAIECFEERLVSVEGTVQKEIMSIKSIAEALLHTASGPGSGVPIAPAGGVIGGSSSSAVVKA